MEYAYENDGVGFEQFAKVAEKNHMHSTMNPLAHYQKPFTLEEVMDAEMMSYPNTLLMCCPNTDGSAAVVLVSEEKLRTLSKEQQQRAIKISASVLTTDPWTERAQVQPDVNTLTRNAAKQAYETSGVDPQDLDLVEAAAVETDDEAQGCLHRSPSPRNPTAMIHAHESLVPLPGEAGEIDLPISSASS